METEIKTEGAVGDTTITEGEAAGQQAETVSVAKAEYDKLNQTLGSLKRELKDLKKAQGEAKDTPEKTKAGESDMAAKLEKVVLRSAGITHPDDVALAQKTAKKWGVDIDEVIGDEDFKAKLERQQGARANVEATSGVKGGSGSGQAKSDPAYWLAKGVPPTAADVPDRKARAKIVRSFMDSSRSGKKFHND